MIQKALLLMLNSTPPSHLKGPSDRWSKPTVGQFKWAHVPLGGSYLVSLETWFYGEKADTLITLIRSDWRHCFNSGFETAYLSQSWPLELALPDDLGFLPLVHCWEMLFIPLSLPPHPLSLPYERDLLSVFWLSLAWVWFLKRLLNKQKYFLIIKFNQRLFLKVGRKGDGYF